MQTSVMDFDTTKENIQPLRGGRNVAQLGMALQAQSSEEHRTQLMQQKEEFESAIRNYEGEDPLDNWYHYISWVEQSYPTQGHEGNLVPLLESCLSKFENDDKYKNDRRFCRLWIKYIDLQQNPLELYHMMHAKGLCKGCADLYKAWAYYHEAVGDFRTANTVFEMGKTALAQPYEELIAAHQNLYIAAGQHVISGSNERVLEEKRQALTSLRTYQPGRVSSVRVPSSSGAGTLSASSSTTVRRPNTAVPVYLDASGSSQNTVDGPPSILSAVKRQDAPKENTLKPGTWTGKMKLAHASGAHRTPSFTIHEDTPQQEGLKLPDEFADRNYDDYSEFKLPLCYPEPHDPARVHMYPKSKVYAEPYTEYSIEEIKAQGYLNRLPNRLTVGHTETQQAIQSILGEEMQEDDFVDGAERAKIDLRVQNEQILTMQEMQHREVYETQQQVNEQPDQQEILQQQQEQTLSSSRREPIPPFPIYQSPPREPPQEQIARGNPQPFQVLSPADKSDDGFLNDLWTSDTPCIPKQNVSKFVIHEASNLWMQPQIQAKGSAMKTPFRMLTAEDLAETGSRGGLDVAAAAQPGDGAKRLANFEDDNSTGSSFDQVIGGANGEDSLTCNTQMFNFNLNAMKVSTPQKAGAAPAEGAPKEACKQLFGENGEKMLSTILEETKSYGSNSSSQKSKSKRNSNMTAISEPHHNYFAQNMMANAALRSSLLGDLMECDSQQSSPVTESPPPPVLETVSCSAAPLEEAPSDPFRPALLAMLLRRVSFPRGHSYGYQIINSHPRLQVKKEPFRLGDDRYLVEKQLAKGAYGTVFKAVDVRTNRVVALKYQKPPNKWEFYICREIQKRLALHPLRDRFMDIHAGYFHDQASVLVSTFSPCGSLLDVRNAFKQKVGQSLKQSVVMYLCIDMLRVVQALHNAQIIHADIKPDNFLVQLAPDGTVNLHLIDFGCSIDMSLFPPGTTFTQCVTTENFVCCEMRDGRPWSYHTDLFCVAATAHALLFDKYIQLQKKDGNWSITQRLSRYMRVDLWNTFFSALLNQQQGPADIDLLLRILSDALQNENSFAGDMRVLVNVLKDR